MLSGAAGKSALRAKQHEEEGEGATQAPQEVETTRYRLEEGDSSSHAQKIVRELYFRYEKQLQRWRDYRNLVFFLAFVAWFLAVLYLQRDASVAYKVHSTLTDVLVPNDEVMKGTDEVYAWLQNTLQAVWVDPVCGDGICESPWEFASYSRFGCRADCGKLQDIQNLTKIQVDLNWDFGHPLGSLPASDLMQQTKWNLCPYSGAPTSDCYYDTDQSFELLTGYTSKPILDAPDGEWALNVKRDIFNKVQGAVRDSAMVVDASYYYRHYIAAVSVLAEMNYEVEVLTQAAIQGNMSLFQFINFTLTSNSTNSSSNAFQLQQLINATCACDIYGNTSLPGSPVFGLNAILALNYSMDHFNPGVVFAYTDMAAYKQNYCQRLAGAQNPQILEINNYNLTVSTINDTVVFVNGSTNGKYYGPVPNPLPANVTYRTMSNVTELSPNMSTTCTRVLNNALNWRAVHLQRLRSFMIDWRVCNSANTCGKFAVRTNIYNKMRNYIILNMRELFNPIYNARGSVPMKTGALTASIEALQEYYLAGPMYYSVPPPAALAISRRTIYSNPNITGLDIVQRANARIAEVQGQMQDTLINVTLIPPPTSSIGNKTILEVVSQFLAAGASDPLVANVSNVFLPDANSTALGDLRFDYNLVFWQGNTSAYMQCNLDQRGPKWLGVCQPMNVTCLVQANDTVPYICTDIASNTTIGGSLNNLAYRLNCEMPCDQYLDCNTVCECYGACSNTELCVCDACTELARDAASDKEFGAIKDTANNRPSGIATVGGGSRRSLQQNSPDLSSQLSGVLSQVTSVRQQQVSITDQMTKLAEKVDRANALAQARADDNRLIDLIAAGRQDIAAGQKSVEAKLDEIIGKQNASLRAAEQATQALSAIQGLQSQQLAALEALAQAVDRQLSAIKTATYQNVITLTQALALWKRARRDRALMDKAAKLATFPCTTKPTVLNNFTLDNGNAVVITTPRERNVGLTNRVISGMLLHSFRTNDTNCTESKFSKIQQTCTGPVTLKSYGVDPVFKRGTTLYDPDKDDLNSTIVQGYYYCANLTDPTYNITVLNQTVNMEPFCAELFNARNLPYAFYYFPLKSKTDGFPVFFDINLGEQGAQDFYTYLVEGLYLDQHTRSFTAELITYNAPLRIFGYFFVEFYFSDGGSIKVTHKLHTVRVELYNGYDDDVRFALEIILSIWIFSMLLYTFFQIAWTQKEKRNFLKFFTRAWNIVDFISNGLLASCMIMWWIIVTKYAKTFDIQLRYDVYANLEPDANFLALANAGKGMNDSWSAFSDLRDLIDMLNWYFALNGINILLLIARVLKLMDFQPRLGVVTRSLWLAGPDLIHFAIVAGMVFVGYAMMAHLIFGNAIQEFSTFGESVNTCFEILLGNIDVNDQLRNLGGLQSVAGALFFWSYELLVFMVLLNFLLAIIVDAFSEVKEKTHETVGIHTELYQLLRDKWRSLMGRCSSNYISDAKLGQLLKQWAGEEEDQAAQQNVNAEMSKLLTVLNEDLDEEDLRTVLMECLKDAPAAEEDEKANTARSRCLPGRKRVSATPNEVAMAAKYIVDRFGVPVEAEDAEQEEAVEHVPDVGAGGGHGDAVLDKERDQLAQALERLADVQRELAEGQRNLMVGQKQLAEQQAKLVTLMASETRND